MRGLTPQTAAFVDKWLAAEPEARLAAVFIRAPLRNLHALLGALQFELEDAALRISEPAVAEVKIGWWYEELERSGAGAPRHPLTSALAAFGDSHGWRSLAANLLPLHRFEAAPTLSSMLDRLGGWNEAWTALCAALSSSAPEAWPARDLGDIFLMRRLRELSAQVSAGRLWLPLDLMAGHGLARHRLGLDGEPSEARRARTALAKRLLARQPGQHCHPMLGIAHAHARLRLEHMARGGHDRLPALSALWRAWRAALA